MNEMETSKKLALGHLVGPGDRLMACAWAVRRIEALESERKPADEHLDDCAAHMGAGCTCGRG